MIQIVDMMGSALDFPIYWLTGFENPIYSMSGHK